MSICLMQNMCVCICLSELTLQRDVLLWYCKIGFSEALPVSDSRSRWEKKHARLFNSIPSCLYVDHRIPCELRLSTLTWKGEWHNSGPSGRQSQRALSPFVWRGKGLLLNPSLSAYNSKEGGRQSVSCFSPKTDRLSWLQWTKPIPIWENPPTWWEKETGRAENM